jgi:Ca-activated chloride channel homolog
MLRRNSFAPLLILISLTILLTANAQTTSGTPPTQPSGQTGTPASPPAQTPGAATPASPTAQAPGTATPASPPAAPSSAPAAPVGNNGAAQAPATEDSGVFVFKKEVEEVVLHATVIDDKQAFVTNLEKAAFTVYENGRPQTITSFRHEDIPVAMGIVVDNSGSMREKRQKVNAAALNLVRASNSNDEVFIVNFNDEYYLDQDFTSSIAKLKEGLEKIEARGGTALYDAVVASSDHLKSAKLEKKVIFVVTDGEDNASAENLEQAVRRLQAENGPTVYAIGILGDEEHPRRAKRALAVMSERTGGVAFFPKTLDEVDAISREVARDIRNQYTIGYKPSTPKNTGGYRTIKVDARAHGHGKLIVRTKSGYYAGQERAAGGE